MDMMTENRPSPKGSKTMRAAAFRGPGKIQLEQRPLPDCGPIKAACELFGDRRDRVVEVAITP
jgi:hypothetical protein